MTKIFKMFLYIFLFYYIPLVYSQPNQKYKCGHIVHNLKVGEVVTLCIHILSENKKLAMQIKVDEYSMLSFNRISDLILNKEIELIAQIGETITISPTVSKQYNYININYSYITMTQNALIC